MVNWQKIFYRGKQFDLKQGEYSIFRRTTSPSKYREEIKEKIEREKKRLRSYFTKAELSNKTSFLEALEREFSKRNDKGADVGKTLRSKPEIMWSVLKESEAVEVWHFVKQKQNWEVKCERNEKGQFTKGITRIKMLVQDADTEENRSSYSEGEESKESSYSI